MSLNRYAVQRDENERAIIDALEKCGCSVEQLDVIDLLVERAGVKFLLEVKRPKGGKLTPAQLKFRRRFTFCVVTSPIDALRAVGLVDWHAVIERRAAEAEKAIAADLARMGAKP